MPAIDCSSSNPIIDIRNDYYDYIDKFNKDQGLCFGTSLYWASQSLSEMLSNTTTESFNIENRNQFFERGFSTHKWYRSHFTRGYKQANRNGIPTYQKLIGDLNAQQKMFLEKTFPRLTYSLMNGDEVALNINRLSLYSHLHRNKAIIIGTATAEREHRHATALANIDGVNYFFDANRGVYCFGREHPGLAGTILDTIRRNLFLPPDKPCIFSKAYSHIAISADTSLTSNFIEKSYPPHAPSYPFPMSWYEILTKMPSQWLPGPVFRSGVLNGWSKN